MSMMVFPVHFSSGTSGLTFASSCALTPSQTKHDRINPTKTSRRICNSPFAETLYPRTHLLLILSPIDIRNARTLAPSGARLRVAVQLVDTSSGAHLWAETYDRPFSAEDFFAIQDELVPIIVSTVADQYGVLPRKMSEALHGKDESQLTPYEAILRCFAYFERLTADSHARAVAALERATQQAPEVADCWAMLSMLIRGQHVYGFKGEPDPLGRALIAARRAVETGPANHIAYFALAATLFFRRIAAVSVSQRSVASNLIRWMVRPSPISAL
jgi:hypothetical protein